MKAGKNSKREELRKIRGRNLDAKEKRKRNEKAEKKTNEIKGVGRRWRRKQRRIQNKTQELEGEYDSLFGKFSFMSFRNL